MFAVFYLKESMDTLVHFIQGLLLIDKPRSIHYNEFLQKSEGFYTIALAYTLFVVD
jgi:hypothetical protein